MLNSVQLVIQQHALLCKATFQLVSHQCILVHGVIPLQVQDFAFAFVELNAVPGYLYLQPDWIPLMPAQPSEVSVTLPSFALAEGTLSHHPGN